MKALIFGHFDCKNIGAELSKILIRNIFPKSTSIAFTSPYSIEAITDDVSFIVYIGDIIPNSIKLISNMKELWEIKNNSQLPCYGISVSIPPGINVSSNKSNYFDIFDKIIVRNMNDYNLLKTRYGSKFVEYQPDIISLMPKYIKINKSPVKNKKTIGIFLSNSIKTLSSNYNDTVTKLAYIISILAKSYNIDLVPSFYDINEKTLCDDIINNEVYVKIQDKTNITVITALEVNTPLYIVNKIAHYDFTICANYHAAVLSHSFSVPSISIFLNNDLKKFVNDNKLNHFDIKSINDDMISKLINTVKTSLGENNPKNVISFKSINYSPNSQILTAPVSIKMDGKKNIGVYLANPLKSIDDLQNEIKNNKYNTFVKKLASLLSTLSNNYNIQLLSSECMPNNGLIDKINSDVHLVIGDKIKLSHSSVYKSPLDIHKNLSQFDFVICMPLSIHILCITYDIPFVSLCINKKLNSFIDENKLHDFMIDIRPNNAIIPNDIDSNKVITLISAINEGMKPLHYLPRPLNYVPDISILRSSGPYLLTENKVNEIYDITCLNVVKYLCDTYNINFIQNQNSFVKSLKQSKTISDFIVKTLNIKKNKFKHCSNTLASVIDYYITGETSKYCYGIEQKKDTLNLLQTVQWILNEVYMNGKPQSIVSIQTTKAISQHTFNMEHIAPESMTGYHRSGWRYVVNGLLRNYNNPNAPIILDTYLDKTFGWKRKFYKHIDKIPYLQPWAGFAHHTPNIKYSQYNTVAMLKNPLFLQSLQHCKGLFVMSTYLKEWFEAEFAERNISVPVYLVYHPTEFVTQDNKFTIEKFLANTNRKIIQIGGWLRNSYCIYRLNLLNEKLILKKAALKGKAMDNYFKPESFDFNKLLIKDSNEIQNICGNICGNNNKPTKNLYIRGLVTSLIRNHKSTKIITQLSDAEYDTLLTENVVFLNLADASACNTLIECMVRNTPIFINRLPAVIEMLGENYPLYYDTIAEATTFADSIEKITEAHQYLKAMNKSKLRLVNFLSSFETHAAEIYDQL
jgi:polysaccharide pyruvyl transferase WcaK-like protein